MKYIQYFNINFIDSCSDSTTDLNKKKCLLIGIIPNCVQCDGGNTKC